MRRRHAFSLILGLCLSITAVFPVGPVSAEYWVVEDNQTSGSGFSYSGRWEYSGSAATSCGGSDYLYTWSGDPGSACIAHTGVCCPTAFARCTNTTTLMMRWVPQGEPSPPDHVWLHESAGGNWRLYGSGGCAVSGSGSAYTSLGVTEYSVDRSISTESTGIARAERYHCVAVIDGLVTSFGGGSGYASCSVGGCNGTGEASAGGSFGYHVEERSFAPPTPQKQKTSDVPYRVAVSKTLAPGSVRMAPIGGANLRGTDPVDLATGSHMYPFEPDITVYNPYGPSVEYQRTFYGDQAESGYASPGLSAGWADTYDAVVTAVSPGTWGQLRLTYPNGAEEILVPALSSGLPTGEFVEPTGSPYFVQGVASQQVTGRWESVTITWKDQTRWVFMPGADNNAYPLSRIGNRIGAEVVIVRNLGNGNRITSITDSRPVPTTLLTFAYDGQGRLSSVTDAYGRKVMYTFDSSGDLTTVSQLSSAVAADPPARWVYAYQYMGSPSRPHLRYVDSPNPAGVANMSRQEMEYDTATCRVKSLTDANGCKYKFTYGYDGYNNATRVQVTDHSDTMVQEWVEEFDLEPGKGNRHTGTMDAKGFRTAILYEDTDKPWLPTRFIDKNGRQTAYSYDQFGNVLTVQDARDTVTTYSYDYPGDQYPSEFALGRLRSIQEGDKAATSFTYYEPNGLVHVVTSPQPGGGTTTTSFTYDALGNVLTKTAPGNGVAQTTTYNYTQDGEYSQTAKIGQPLTVTDSLGHVSHFRYDDRGNVVWSKDAALPGNETSFTYNIADQPVAVVYPSAQ